LGLLIDSSVLIDIERRQLSLSMVIEDGSESSAISALTVSELLFGLYRASSSEQRMRRETFLNAALTLLPVLPFDLTVARTHARIWSDLVASGQRIGAHDFMIAATAVAYGYAVLTHNVREFSRVPGLDVRLPAW
jgi:predicted nucleic acid-binding protein